jgi:hypothetical protein
VLCPAQHTGSAIKIEFWKAVLALIYCSSRKMSSRVTLYPALLNHILDDCAKRAWIRIGDDQVYEPVSKVRCTSYKYVGDLKESIKLIIDDIPPSELHMIRLYHNETAAIVKIMKHVIDDRFLRWRPGEFLVSLIQTVQTQSSINDPLVSLMFQFVRVASSWLKFVE